MILKINIFEKLHKNAFKFKIYFYGFLRSKLGVKPRTKLSKNDLRRVNYYIKKDRPFDKDKLDITQKTYNKSKGSYYIDFEPVIRNFPKWYKFSVIFGDVTHIPDVPTFVKSRPVEGNNKNSVLLKLNTVRHYYTYPDRKLFAEKKPIAVWRGNSHFKKRLNFVKNFYYKDYCNIGDTHKKSMGKPYHKDYLTIKQQLEYRYIISIEGNDVATNLKWIMNSNSLCMMVKPEFETWFMEGLLIPGFHYVELKPDYSDLKEKIDYYNKNHEEAIKIIRNANSHANQFNNQKKEDAISYEVMKIYFKLSGQAHD